MALGSITEWVQNNPDKPFIYFVLIVFAFFSGYKWLEICREIKKQPRVVGPRYSQGEKKQEAIERIWKEYGPVNKIAKWAWFWSFVFWVDFYVALPDLGLVSISKIPFTWGLSFILIMTTCTNVFFGYVVAFGLRKEDAIPPE